jgi:hypothetical protein
VTQNLLDYRFFLDKTNNLHLATAHWTFQGIDTSTKLSAGLLNTFTERCPCYATFAPKGYIPGADISEADTLHVSLHVNLQPYP